MNNCGMHPFSNPRVTLRNRCRRSKGSVDTGSDVIQIPTPVPSSPQTLSRGPPWFAALAVPSELEAPTAQCSLPTHCCPLGRRAAPHQPILIITSQLGRGEGGARDIVHLRLDHLLDASPSPHSGVSVTTHYHTPNRCISGNLGLRWIGYLPSFPPYGTSTSRRAFLMFSHSEMLCPRNLE